MTEIEGWSRGRSLLAAVSMVVALCMAGLTPPRCVAQSTWTHTDAQQGFELKLPRWLEAVPAKPGDLQILAQFKGRTEVRSGLHKGEVEITVWVVKILKQAGPTTGDGDAPGAKPDEPQTPAAPELRSLTDQRTVWLNGGRTLAEFLERRELQSSLAPNPRFWRRPVELAEDRPFEVLEIGSTRGVKYGALLRAFVVEDDQQIFGIVMFGGGLDGVQRDMLKVVQSMRLLTGDDAERAARRDRDAEDPYPDGSPYRDVERRREVRDELVAGWQAFDSDNFILVTNVRSSKLIDAMLTDLEVMHAAYLERFPPAEGADMSAVSTVRVCDGYDDYLRYAGQDMDGTGGYWAFVEEELVLFNPEKRVPKARPWLKDLDPVAVLYHEAMHQYFHYSNRALAPACWFNEGYGEVFGGAKVDRAHRRLKDIEPNDFRLGFIRLDNKNKATPPRLETLLRMTQPEFYSRDPMRNYAYAWAFCYFLEKQRERTGRSRRDEWADLPDHYLQALRRATEKRRADLPDDAPDDWINAFQFDIQREAIDEVLAPLDLADLESEWQKFLRRM
ncbi:MAG: DUF1570 domain-containing protein [Planctomycetes bacterium]|nr:DUF1570 domain-containing protein [Planctomycetota bacterium]